MSCFTLQQMRRIFRSPTVSSKFLNRMASTKPVSPKEVSPHIGFYKTFGRPIAKVFLMSTFTYQMAYWLWVKLEKDEIQAERQAEISALEMKLQDLTTKE